MLIFKDHPKRNAAESLGAAPAFEFSTRRTCRFTPSGPRKLATLFLLFFSALSLAATGMALELPRSVASNATMNSSSASLEHTESERAALRQEIEEATAALNENPSDAKAALRLAEAAVTLEPESAEAYVRNAEKLLPGDMRPYFLFGLVYKAKSDFAAAEKAFLRALELEDIPQTRIALAFLYIKDMNRREDGRKQLIWASDHPNGYPGEQDIARQLLQEYP